MTHWRDEATQAFILYRIHETNDEVDFVAEKWDPVRETLEAMSPKHIQLDDDGNYALTERGVKCYEQLVDLFDRLSQFELLARVSDGPDPEDFEFDIRFDADDPVGEDFRLGVLEHMVPEADPHMFVWLTMLSNGDLDNVEPLSLNEELTDVEAVVASASLVTKEVAEAMWEAARTEMQKRAGPRCSECDAPLQFAKSCDDSNCLQLRPEPEPQHGGEVTETTTTYTEEDAGYCAPYGYYDPSWTLLTAAILF